MTAEVQLNWRKVSLMNLKHDISAILYYPAMHVYMSIYPITSMVHLFSLEMLIDDVLDFDLRASILDSK